jgi:thiol-disulfide isomerase/thioredoxin
MLLAAAVGGAMEIGGSALGQEAASATLKMEPTTLDAAGSRATGTMYMPSGLDLKAEKPAWVTATPKFRTTPRWGSLSVGSGEGSTRAVVVDEPEGAEARIWLDLNGNGDLTDDNDGTWPTSSTGDDGVTSYSGTFVFDVRWQGEEGKEATTAKYGLNFYYSPVRDRINYYRAGVRHGQITIDGQTHEIRLIDNDNDARYDKKFAPDAVAVDPMPKPVWLLIDGDQYDARGTFQYGGINYEPFISDDGSQITIKPTFRVIRIPQPVEERPDMLAAGAAAPEFFAMMWTGSEAVPEQQFEFADVAKDKVVVLDLWASWCGPCKAGLPHLSELAEKVKGKNVRVIAMNVYDDEKAYKKFIGAHEAYAFDWARDPAGREKTGSIAAQKFNVFAIPATFVIKDGKVVASISGYREGDHSLEAALKEAGVTLE